MQKEVSERPSFIAVTTAIVYGAPTTSLMLYMSSPISGCLLGRHDCAIVCWHAVPPDSKTTTCIYRLSMGQTLASVLKNGNLFEFSNRSQEFDSTITLISQMKKSRDKGFCDMPEVKLLISGRVITDCDPVHPGHPAPETCCSCADCDAQGFGLRESWVQTPPLPHSVPSVKAFLLFHLFPHV